MFTPTLAFVTAALAVAPPSFDAPALKDAAAMGDYLVSTRGLDDKRVVSVNDA